MLIQLTWYLLFPWWVIWSFNASSALTMQENERFEIDSFTFTSQKRLQRCQKWFLHNQQEYLSPFHLDLIDWCQFCSAINYNFFFYFFYAAECDGNKCRMVSVSFEAWKSANSLFSSTKQNLHLSDKMDHIFWCSAFTLVQ